MATTVQLMHLYWRAGFGCSPSEWKQRQGLSINTAVEGLFSEAKQSRPLSEAGLLLTNKRAKDLSPAEKKALKDRSRQLLADANVDWVMRMALSAESALLERMSLFWHGHFACESKTPLVAIRQLNALREHALGNFKDLVLAIARDPSMIRYLNNQQNKKRAPNENFARELLELFTLGIGHYSEQDIKEAARAFTGWSSNMRGEFIFRERQHDFDSKTFMGKTGNFDGEDIIDIILEQPQAARFIVSKIYRYFVNETPDEARIQQLATQFYQSNYDIGKLMYSIFTSDWFYDAKNIGTKIKSPIELFAGIFRTLSVSEIDAKSLIYAQRVLGQTLFKPPNVAGWKGGKAWIDNATLLFRLNLVEYLQRGSKVRARKQDNDEMMQSTRNSRKAIVIDIHDIMQELDNSSEQETYVALRDYLLPSSQNIDASKILPFVDKSTKESYIKSLILRLMSVPEYQLC